MSTYFHGLKNYIRATINVIPALFVKHNKMDHLLKKGKKPHILVYGGKKG